jgi:hypothetical protein
MIIIVTWIRRRGMRRGMYLLSSSIGAPLRGEGVQD